MRVAPLLLPMKQALAYLALAAALLALVACIRERRHAASMPVAQLLRERFGRLSMSEFATGIALGSFAIALPFAVAWQNTWVATMPADGSRGIAGVLLLGTATVAVKLLWAAMEELVYRGALQPQLAKRFGGAAALVAGSLLFALSHLERSGDSAPGVLSLTVLTLDGIAFGLAYAATRSLWLGTAWHAAKNIWIWLLGGGTLQFTPGVIEARYTGPELWIGGLQQAGLLDLIATLLTIAFITLRYRRRLIDGVAWTGTQ